MSFSKAKQKRAFQMMRDLNTRNEFVYYCDLFFTVFIWWVGFIDFIFIHRLFASVSFSIGVLALIRAASFMHEIVHMRESELRPFKWCWNLLVGFPFLLPWHFYLSHLDHHSVTSYGTAGDPEYLQFKNAPYSSSLIHIVLTILSPFFLVLRFLILEPASWISITIRRFVERHCSWVTINPQYVSKISRRRSELCSFRAVEISYSLGAWMVTYLMIQGFISSGVLFNHLIFLEVALLINSFRTRLAHRYLYQGKLNSSLESQFEDTCTHATGAIWDFIAPVGLRFHAIHHLLPFLPYHQLYKAHVRLTQDVEFKTEYMRTFNLRALKE